MLIHDHFQNFKSYAIPKAQLIIADIPYNIGINAIVISKENPQLAKELQDWVFDETPQAIGG